MKDKGIKIAASDGQLHFSAPKGALSEEDRSNLRTYKNEILQLLGRPSQSDHPGQWDRVRDVVDCAPLSFAQLAHWNLYNLKDCRAIRQVACATQLDGPLDSTALSIALVKVAERHAALRTNVVVLDGTPMQVIHGKSDLTASFEACGFVPRSDRAAVVTSFIRQSIMEQIDVATDPLCAVRVLRFDENEHVLIVAMEHMISDASSLGVFLRDVFYAYSEIRHKGAVCWPTDPLQFQMYAASQRRGHGRWCEKHARYWSEHMHAYERVRFPADPNHVGPFSGWGSVSITVEISTLTKLLECCRMRRTTPAMAACSAFVSLIARWCNASDIVVQYIVDGRSDPLLENAIGCFATRLSLRVGVLDDDTLIDIQKRVMDEYCRAHEHADAGYIESQMPRPAFLRSCAFNWIPREAGGAATAESAQMGSRDIPFEHPMLDTMEKDHDPVLLLFASSTALFGSILFPRSRFSEGYIERLRDAYLQILERFISRPEAHIRQLIQD